MNSTQKSQIEGARNAADIRNIANQYKLWQNGKILIADSRLTLDYSEIDMSVFQFERVDLSGSRFINCNATSLQFSNCKLKRVQFRAEKGSKSSLAGASFGNSRIQEAYFGPRTLDLDNVSFSGARLENVEFMLGSLTKADFAGSTLKDVSFRKAILDGASFVNAILERVCLEGASLKNCNFTGASFVEMEHWGEPNFTGAIISDDLRYQYGIVRDPVGSIDRVIDSNEYTSVEREALKIVRERVATFAANAPEAMLIATEYQDVIAPALFVRMLKQIKAMQ